MNRGFGIQPFPGLGPRGGFFGARVHDGGGWPDSLSWVIFALLLALLLIAIVSLALDAYHRSQRRSRWAAWFPPGIPPGDRALSLLGVRYARGEISREDFLQARADLAGPLEPAAEAPTETIPPAP
jgi:putative membrane protein